jgi:hypothetical protein
MNETSLQCNILVIIDYDYSKTDPPCSIEHAFLPKNVWKIVELYIFYVHVNIFQKDNTSRNKNLKKIAWDEMG